MKLLTIILLSIVAIQVANSQIKEPTVSDNRLIVYGTSSVNQQADRARINFSVKSFGPSIREAVHSVREKAAWLTHKLLAAGLQENNLYTSGFNSGANSSRKRFSPPDRDYSAQIDVNVTVDSLPLLEPVVEILTSRVVDHLSTVSYSLKSDSSVKLEARRLAVANAQEKARLMTDQLGVTLGKVVHIEELPLSSEGEFQLLQRDRGTTSYSSSAGSLASVNSSQPTVFFSRTFSIRADVKVIFEITSK